MTEKEINNLQVGKETDALIQEYVMKLVTTYIATTLQGNCTIGNWTDLETCKSFCEERSLRSTNYYGNEINWVLEPKPYGNPKYSSSWESTGLLVDKLRSCGKFCCVKIAFDYGYCTDVSLTLSSEDYEDLHTPIVRLTDENFHLAVCKAALMAKFIGNVEF